MQFDYGDKDSKTEAIWFPSRSKISKWLSNNKYKRTFLFKNYLTVTDPNKREIKLSYNKVKEILSKTYDKAEETRKNIVKNKIFVSFTTSFKSLRSWILYDLYDNFDINKQLMKTN